MIKKILIINQFYMKMPNGKIGDYHVDFMMLYRNIPSYLKIFRYFHERLRLPFFSIWYISGWEQKLSDYDSIILHDAIAYHNNYFIDKINQFAPKTERFLYYWNSVHDLQLLKNTQDWDILSFDYQDSKNNGLRYVGGFYCPINYAPQEEQYDMFFIGINKGRFDFIKKIKTSVLKHGLKPLFLLVSKKHFFSKKYSKPMAYSVMLEKLMQSKSVLDITKEDQFGLTLRVYEALFYNKKLITNNKNIEYYKINQDNIFLIKENFDISALTAFLTRDFVDFADEVKQQYRFEEWVKRVDTKQTLHDVNL